VFAAGGANTRTAQLFINLRDNPRLDAMSFAPLGEVVRGIDVVDAIHTEYARIPGGPQPDQRAIMREGEAYLAREFPLLDVIQTARIVRTWPARR
jgi:peptidyl-prolyl cis-trans isomerase A (cyclophilin A)